MKLLIYILLIFISFPIFSQNYSIKSIIDSTTFKYYEDSDGDLIVSYKTITGREQQVIVRKHTNSFQNVEIREIISIAKIFENKTIPEKLTSYLLIDNYSTKYLGNWAIHKKEDIATILFVVKLPFNSNSFFLEAAITEAAEAADALEKALEEEIDNSDN